MALAQGGPAERTPGDTDKDTSRTVLEPRNSHGVV